jgi:hypothetical protein
MARKRMADRDRPARDPPGGGSKNSNATGLVWTLADKLKVTGQLIDQP